MSYAECAVLGCGNAVFSSKLCRKHYEQVRLSTALPCSISGCNKQSFRGELCEPHYRADMLAKRPPCSVPNCGQPQKNLKLQLCNRHEFRARKHGSVAQTRPTDWGSRETHELYSTWCWHKRKGAAGMCEEWRNNFWAFANAIESKPANHTLRRPNTKQPLSASNWEWKESIPSQDKAAYSRQWIRQNPRQAKSIQLKKMYGITIDQYEAMFLAQNNVCAICFKSEQSKDKDGGARGMPVDHCHTTGEVRGLLCTSCNRALGMFKDNVDNLRSAIKYLEQTTCAVTK